MEKKGTKTLFFSVIMSAPGPLVLGIGLLLGQSNTQIADFVRRTIELLAIIVSFFAYQLTVKRQLDKDQTARLERNTNLFVGAAMIVAGMIMLCITLLSKSEDKGNVLFGLIIALLGVTANSLFWLKYKRLAKTEQSTILEVQSRLYRAKTFVDFCVTVALCSVLLFPKSQVSHYLDIIGSLVVSLYLGYSGVKIIVDKIRKAEITNLLH